MKRVIEGINYGVWRIRKVIWSNRVIKWYSKKAVEKFWVVLIVEGIVVSGISIVIVGVYVYMQKVLIMSIIGGIMLIIKSMYVYILKKNGWDGRFPISDNKKLNEFFKKHKIINKIGIYIYTYINIWRIFLIGRNIYMVGMRYVRYVLKKMKILKYWVKVEKVLTFIMSYIILNFVADIIRNVYLKMKENIIKEGIKGFLLGRLKVILIGCIVYKVSKVIVIYIIWRFIVIIYEVLEAWALKPEGYLKSYGLKYMNLNYSLHLQSYILSNLEFPKSDRYIGFWKLRVNIEYAYFGEDWYHNEPGLQYEDLVGGVRLSEIDELNIVLVMFLNDRVIIKYNLENEYGDNELLLRFQEYSDKMLEVLKQIRGELIEYGIKLEYIVVWCGMYDYSARLYIRVSKEGSSKKYNKSLINYVGKLNELLNASAMLSLEKPAKGVLDWWDFAHSFHEFIESKYEDDTNKKIEYVRSKYIKTFLNELVGKNK